jgi:DNA polymerase-3 subunit delta
VRLRPREVEAFLQRPSAEARVVLLYGPDRGLAAERRRRLITAWLDDPGDPLALTVLEADQLRSDPARLIDEVQAYSMLGGRRAVRVSEAADGLTRIVTELLALPGTEAPVVLEAGDLGPSSSLRKLCDARPGAVAIPCYRQDEQDLARSLREHAQRLGLRVEPAAMAYLVAQLGADAAITRREIEKLDLYLGERRDVRLADAAAVVGDSSALELDQLLNATGTGDVALAMRLVERLVAARQAPVAVIRALQAHWLRLWRLRLQVEAGGTVASVVDNARPPIFFKARPAIAKALDRSGAVALRSGLGLLLETERRIKTTGLPAADILRHVVLDLTAPHHPASGQRMER